MQMSDTKALIHAMLMPGTLRVDGRCYPTSLVTLTLHRLLGPQRPLCCLIHEAVQLAVNYFVMARSRNRPTLLATGHL
jgi:hypothetical protein